VTQSWDADRYARSARFVSDLGAPVLDLLAPKPGERILDLGCGDGELTEKIAAAGATVVGVDASPNMVAAARDRGLDAREMDGQALTFSAEFDAVFSNAALHWMRRADNVLVGVLRALRPGGRFVAEMGGKGNVEKLLAAIVRALEKRGVDGSKLEFRYYPSIEEYRGKLEAHGFAVDQIELIPRPTPLAGGLNDWLENFGEVFFATVDPSEHAALRREIDHEAAADLQRPDGSWFADYMRLRFKAHLPG
jgi:trans-aconitate methyltransferase